MGSVTAQQVIGHISGEEIESMLKAFVACPSHPGVSEQETKTAEAVAAFFEKEGIAAEIIPVVDGRSNVVARLKGTGGGKTLLLTGHTDTVPPYDMAGDPFTVTEKDGKLYGRGVVDMKGALACMMEAIFAIKRSGAALAGDVVFAGVIDEEDGSEGTIALLESGLKVDAAIVGEPTEMEVCTGHRGLEWLEFSFHGKTVHGGKQKEGVNAIHKAVKFINKIENELIPALEARVHPLIGPSTMNYGTIAGGTQPSTVAGECTLRLDRRFIPAEKYEDMLAEYQRVLDELAAEDPEFKADFKVMDCSVMRGGCVHEAMETDTNDPIVRLAQEAITAETGKTPPLRAFTAWSDGGLIGTKGKIPTIILGPGDLESAHSATEHIAIADLAPAAAIYARIAMDLCK